MRGLVYELKFQRDIEKVDRIGVQRRIEPERMQTLFIPGGPS